MLKIGKKYKFSDKHQSLGGTISTILGVASLALLGYGISISFKAGGNAGVYIGSIGLCSLLLSIFGCVMGLISFKEDDKFYFLSKFGSLLCGIITVLIVAILMMGL